MRGWFRRKMGLRRERDGGMLGIVFQMKSFIGERDETAAPALEKGDREEAALDRSWGRQL